MPDREDRTFRRQGMLSIVDPDEGQFVLRATHIPPDATKIRPRPWIYGWHLIRGYVTLLVAPGGTGKTSLILAILIAIATNRPLFGQRIHQQCNTGLLNLEDPQDEIDRRLAALALHYNIRDEDLTGRFFMSPAEAKVLIAAESSDGFDIVHPHERRIIERVRDERIGVLGVDPFAESHQLEENSNPHMIRASAAWRRVAREGDCAVLLAHHIRKGIADSIEAARGAKALTDSARVGLLLSTMTETDAAALGITEEDRQSYIRLDDAKANMAPRAGKASWFHIGTCKLGNGTPEYPNGDSVAVVEPWKPETVWDRLSTLDCNLVLDEIRDGLPNGARYSDRKGDNRWAGQVLIRLYGVTEGQAAEAIKQWLKSGTLIREQYHDAVQRKLRTGLTVVESERPGATHG
jgi:hypothetical protein